VATCVVSSCVVQRTRSVVKQAVATNLTLCVAPAPPHCRLRQAHLRGRQARRSCGRRQVHRPAYARKLACQQRAPARYRARTWHISATPALSTRAAAGSSQAWKAGSGGGTSGPLERGRFASEPWRGGTLERCKCGNRTRARLAELHSLAARSSSVVLSGSTRKRRRQPLLEQPVASRFVARCV